MRKPKRLRLELECLERRILLGANELVTGISGTTGGGMAAWGGRLQDVMESEAVFADTHVPGLLQQDAEGEASSPTVVDMLALDTALDRNGSGTVGRKPFFLPTDAESRAEYLDDLAAAFIPDPERQERALDAMDLDTDGRVDWGEAFEVLVGGHVTSFLNDVSFLFVSDRADYLTSRFEAYLNGLSEPGYLDDLIDLNTGSVTDNSVISTTLDTFAFEFDVTLTLKDDQAYLADLGFEAEQSEITFPDNPRLRAGGSITHHVGFSIDTGSGSVTAADFSVAEPEDFVVSVATLDASGNPTAVILNENVNVGFLGTRTVNDPDDSTFELAMPVDVSVTDPSSPAHLGFEASLPIEDADGTIVASSAPDSFVLSRDVIFSLQVGQGNPVQEITVPAGATDGTDGNPANTSLDDLVSDVQDAIDAESAALGDLVTVGKTGDGTRMTLSLPLTDAGPLGFSDEAYDDDADAVVRLLASDPPAGDGATAYEFTSEVGLLLSIDGAVPHLLTVPATDPAIEQIGFAPAATAALDPLVAAGAAPPDGELSSDATFNVSVTDGNAGTTTLTSVTVSVSDPDGAGPLTGTDDNTTRSDLADDIDSSLASVGLGAYLDADVAAGGKIRLTALDADLTSIKVGSGAGGIGFDSGGQSSVLSLEGSAAASAGPFDGEATFDLVVDYQTGPTTAYVVTVPAADVGDNSSVADLADDVDTALADAVPLVGGGSADLSGDVNAVAEGGRIVLKLRNGALTSVEGLELSVPKVTKGNTVMGDLVADLNRVLDDAGIADVYAGQVFVGSDRVLTLNLSGGSSLEISRTLTLDADGFITHEELTESSTDQLFEATGDSSSAVFDVHLNVLVKPGITDTTSSPFGPWQPRELVTVDIDPFTETTFLPGAAEGQGRLDYDVQWSAGFEDFLDFNVVGSSEVVGLLGQLATWLDRFGAEDLMTRFEVAFADAALGDALDFGDLVRDGLIINDADDGLEPDTNDDGRLLEFLDVGGDSKSLGTTWFTAQELGQKLTGLGLLAGTAFPVRYNTTDRRLEYDITAQHELTAVDAPVDFNLDLGSLVDVVSDATVRLEATAYLNGTFGIKMGEGVAAIEDTTPLADLNDGTGVGINDNLALTGGSDIDPIVGRLTDDATFYVTLAEGGTTTTTPIEIEAGATDGTDGSPANTSLDDLVSDINDALPDSIASDIQATHDGQYVLLKAIGGDVDRFQVNSSSDNPAFTEIGLQPETAATVSLPGTGPVEDVSPVGDFVLRIKTYEGGTATETDVTVEAARTGDNRTVTDLVLDINEALPAGLQDDVLATRDGNRIRLNAVNADVDALQIIIPSGSTAAARAIGLDPDAETQRLKDIGVDPATADGIDPLVAAASLRAGDSVQSLRGRLSSSATFTFDIEGSDTTVTVSPDGTNRSVDDLVKDINEALHGEGIGDRIVAENDGFRVSFRALDPTVSSFTVTPGGSAVDELGFGSTALTARPDLSVKANKLAPTSFGVTEDADFSVTVTGGDAAGTYDVSVSAGDTIGNRSMYDLAASLNTALNEAFGGASSNPLRTVAQGDRLVIGLKTQEDTTSLVGDPATIAQGITDVSISADPDNPAVQQLHLHAPGDAPAGDGIDDGTDSISVSADEGDLLIFARDGDHYSVPLDGLPNDPQVGDVLAAISAQAGPDVTAQIGDDEASIWLTDGTGGGEEFRVERVNGSPAALDLGVFGSDTNQVSEAEGEVADGVIEGAHIATIDLRDRFFLSERGGQDLLGADVEVSLPDGITAGATFGFVGVELTSASSPLDLFEARADVGLGAGVSEAFLGDLFEGLEDTSALLDLVAAPTFTPESSADTFQLQIQTEPSIDLISVPSDAALQFEVQDLGAVDFVDTDDNLLPDTIKFALPPTINVSPLDPPGIGDLASFDDMDFDDLLTSLTAVSDFVDRFAGSAFLADEIPVLGLSFDDVAALGDRFSRAVEDIQRNPAGGIQSLEQKLREVFNLPSFADSAERDAYFENLGIPGSSSSLLGLALDDLDGTDDLLKIDLRLPVGFSEGLAVDLDLGNVEFAGGELPVDLQGGAGLATTAYVDARLVLGIDLDDPSDTYLYDGLTRVNGAFSAGANNLTFNAAVGPVGVFIKDGKVQADVAFTFEDPEPGDDSKFLLLDSGTSHVDDLFTDTFSPSLTTGEITATLPVFFPTESDYLDDIILDVSGGNALSLGSGNRLEVPNPEDVLTLPDFSDIDPSKIDPLGNIPLLLDGLDFFLQGVQDTMDGQVFGFELPFMGDQLSGAADFIEQDLRQQIIAPLRTHVEQAPELATDLVQHLFFSVLGPGSSGLPDLENGQTLEEFLDLSAPISGRNLLLDYETGETLSGPITRDVIDRYLPFDDFGGDPGYQWQFRVGSTYRPQVDVNFDVGFPGLGLDADVPLDVEIGWDLALGVGVSPAEGAYVLVDNPRTLNGSPVSEELYLDASVELAEDSDLRGELGFLQLDLEPIEEDFDSVKPWGDPGPDPTQLSGQFLVDLRKGDSDEARLSFSELGALDAEVDLSAEAEVNLLATARFNEDLLPDTISPILPAVSTNLVLDWELDDILSEEMNIGDSLQLVEFQDVEVEMGSFLGDLLGPVAGKVQEVTEPFQPVIDVVTEPIPVVSDLAGRPITLIDIAGMTGYVDAGMIYALADVVDFTNDIPAEPGDLALPLGNFTLVDGASTGGLGASLALPNFSLASDSESFTFDDVVPALSAADVKDILSDPTQAPGDAETRSATLGMLDGSDAAASGFSFPIFEDPQQIFGLLLGRDAELVYYDLAPFGMEFNYTQRFPIWGPLFAKLSAGVGLEIDLAFGYDTAGVRTFAEGDFSNPLDLVDGFFVSDTDVPPGSGGTDVPELILSGEFFAGAELNAGVASAGVEGGVMLDVNFDLYDPDQDGKVRLEEMLGTFLYEVRTGDPALAPIAIFDVYGDVSAQLRAYVKILLAKKSWEITPPITLFEFSLPFDREPLLATERGDGSLLLNVGSNAESRLNGDTRDIDETIKVESISESKVRVWSSTFGVPKGAAQTYSIGSSNPTIEVIGGEGNDVIDLSGVTHSGIGFVVEGRTGNDTIKTGAGPAYVSGGPGEDIVKGGGNGDVIWGGPGSDDIDGGGGADILFGDGGRVTFDDKGTDRRDDDVPIRVFSLAGDGDGADTLSGGGHNDIIFGGGDIDRVTGGTGADLILGDGGRFDFEAGHVPSASPDIDISAVTARGLVGGNDVLFGNAGNDAIFGARGNDVVDGGGGRDQLLGGRGFDTIYGGGGADSAWGGTEDDVIFGRRDPEAPSDQKDTADAGSDGGDTIYGGRGNDYIRGNEGDDEIYGERGADIVFGDENVDTIYGAAGPDIVFGGPQGDVIEAGEGNDIVFGDDGLVAYFGFFQTSEVGDLISDHRVVDADTTGSLVRADSSTGDRLIGEGYQDDDSDGENDLVQDFEDDDNEPTLDLIVTDVESDDGADAITGGDGDDVVLGGARGDTVYGDFDPASPPLGPRPSGADLLIGDGGRVESQDRRFSYAATIAASGGGVDTISGNDDNDYLFGGAEGDFLYGFEPLPAVNDLLSGVEDEDVIVGDNGEIRFDAGVVERIATTDEADGTGGADTAVGFKDDDVIMGGVNGSADVLFGSEGDDVVLGDNGLLDFAYDPDGDLSTLDLILSYRDGLGGTDVISGQEGTDTVMGGTAGDFIYGDDASAGSMGNDGDDIVLGDNGEIRLTGTTGRLIVLDTAVERIRTTDTDEDSGGPDTIEGHAGADIILGGVNNDGTDTLYGDAAVPGAYDGDDVLLGDNGLLDFGKEGDTPDLATLDEVSTDADGRGGIDTISGNAGADIAMGGTAGDEMHGDDGTAASGAEDGEDVLVGDNGTVLLSGTSGRLLVLDTGVESIEATDVFETYGGPDTVEGNAGADVILGGVNNGRTDTLYGDAASQGSNDGDDLILGDNGLVDFNLDDGDVTTLDLVRSYTDGRGSADEISGDAGDDALVGGTGGDSIYGDNATAAAADGDGRDIVAGDNADIYLPGTDGEMLILGSAVETIRTTDEAESTGGADTVEGNAQADIIAGGVSGDLIYGDAAAPADHDDSDVILGDNARLDWASDGDFGALDVDVAEVNDLLADLQTTPDIDLSTLDLITTELPAAQPGGRDTIYGDDDGDILFGGTDADTIYGDDGDEAGAVDNNDLAFGDHGRLYPRHSVLAGFHSRNFFAIDTGDEDGGAGDRIRGEEGDDVLLGQQGDDRLFGGSESDDVIGGHNVPGGQDELSAPAIDASVNPPINDVMDGQTGDDALTGDNAVIWRKADTKNPRFRTLDGTLMYKMFEAYSDEHSGYGRPNVTADSQDDLDAPVGREIELLDHDATTQQEDGTAPREFGDDYVAGGADDDHLFGELGDDVLQGDGSIASSAGPAGPSFEIEVTDSGSPDTGETLHFNVFEAATDGDDYIEGNGGIELIYGGLGQDDIIGGSSNLFGLGTADERPDGFDETGEDRELIFGGAGVRTARNEELDETNNGDVPLPDRHARDSDVIVGDNGNIYRLVGTDEESGYGYLTFNYDRTSRFEERGDLRIRPRAVDLLDYIPAVGDTNENEVAHGDGDVAHGESGDDFIHGMIGTDVLYGESEDDDVYGEAGDDWISGGTGDDGVLGDDGLIFTSRNVEKAGPKDTSLSEPLYGIARVDDVDLYLDTPGDIQQSIINVGDQLKKTVDLTPFVQGGSDIIYGGLGNDFLHGGAGDDAVSGAEALEESAALVFPAGGEPDPDRSDGTLVVFRYDDPVNPGNVLGFEAYRTDEFALYDEYDPLRKILLDEDGNLVKPDGEPATPVREWLLNFEADLTDNDDNLIEDHDVLFGDAGNDWMVGGIGQDRLYGGYGSDLLNVDDRLETNGGANDEPDPPEYSGTNDTIDPALTRGADTAYGGAGRDVLINNTGADRLIDWVGEFNSYLVPYAPFGQFSVSRSLQPHLREYLYDLSESDGADPSRAFDTGTDPDRNGEPEGELGLVLQKDPDWHDQTGAPDDPQAGNIPGGKRDVMEAEDFNSTGAGTLMAPESGAWSVERGAYKATSPDAGDTLSFLYVDEQLPNYHELLATVSAAKDRAGVKSNAYVIFDYYGPTDFKFAGLDVGTDKLQIGRRTADGWEVEVQGNMRLKADSNYNLMVAVHGTTVTLVVDGADRISHTFAPRVIDGDRYPLNTGMVGVGAHNSVSRFDNLAVQKLAPVTTYETTEDFGDGRADGFSVQEGSWAVEDGRYAALDGTAVSTLGLPEGSGATYLELETTLSTGTFGGLVFDYYGPTDFKFVAVLPEADQIVIGHRTARGWFFDTALNWSLEAGADYDLGISLCGTSVNPSLDGQEALGYTYNSLLTDGQVGLLSSDGVSYFDDVAARTAY